MTNAWADATAAVEALTEAMLAGVTPQQRMVAEGVMERHPEFGLIEALAWAESEGATDRRDQSATTDPESATG